MAGELTTPVFLILIILGAVLAIVYALRYVVVMERRIARIETHIENMARAILREERSITRKMKKRR